MNVLVSMLELLLEDIFNSLLPKSVSPRLSGGRIGGKILLLTH